MAVQALMVCSWFPFPITSGNRKRTVRLAEAIERAGAKPVLLTVDRPGPEGVEELEARGWGLHTVSYGGRPRLSRVEQHLRAFPFSEPAPLGDALRRLAPQAAFVQLEEERFIQSFRLLPEGTRSVMSVHNVDSQVIDTTAARGRPYGTGWWKKAWWVKRMQLTERRIARSVDAVLCVSDADRAYFSKHAQRVLLVPNGVDDDLLEIDPSPPEGDGVFFFGQFDYAPNVEGLVRLVDTVWPLVRARRPTARLRIAGAGSDAPRVQSMLGGAEGVELLGFVPDLKTELARNRLVVAPLWSGGGTRLKVLEALAAARPVVGTPFGVGGIGFRDGVHGRVGETPDELAAGVLDLLADETAWRSAAAQARSLAFDFRWPTVTEPAQDMYRSWINGART